MDVSGGREADSKTEIEANTCVGNEERRGSSPDSSGAPAVNGKPPMPEKEPLNGEIPSDRLDLAPEEPLEPPDGGWGWFIVLAGFIATAGVVGLARAFGIIFIEILQTFPDSSYGAVSWIPGLYNTLSTGMAPMAGALSNRYSCRKVVFFGGILMSLGLMLNFFATNVGYFYVTLGIITGCGAGMCTTPGVVMVARYFKKKRALANGLYLSGTSVGAFILPILIRYLSDKYGLRGALLIIGGLTLNISALSLVYRPPILRKRRNKPDPTPIIPRRSPCAKRCCKFFHSLFETLTCHRRKEERVDDVMCKEMQVMLSSKNVEIEANGRGPCNDISKDDVTKESQNEKVTEEKISIPPRPKGKPVTGFRRYLDFTLFRNSAFMLFCFSSGFTSVGYPHASNFMPAYAHEKLKIAKQDTGFLLSLMAATDLVGRIGFGYLSDLKLFKRIHGYQFNIAMAATATLILPLMTSYSALVVNSLFYGLGVGSFFVLKPVLLADHHGADKVSSSYGLMRLFHGMFSLITPPIVGMLVDVTGQYTAGFLLMGSVMMIGSLILFAMPCLLKLEVQKEEKEALEYYEQQQRLLATEGEKKAEVDC